MKNNVYFFVVDETLIVDEDEFELDIVPVLNDIVCEKKRRRLCICYKGVTFPEKVLLEINLPAGFWFSKYMDSKYEARSSV